jgi:polygalacturonase
MTTRRAFVKALALSGSAFLVSPRLRSIYGVPCFQATEDPWSQLPQILKRIKPPVFPKRDFLVTRFRAVGDGKKDCSGAFRQAIANCARAGGGRVVVPDGTYFTGPIHLKSNVNLHITAGGVVKFSQDPKKYLPVVFSRWEGVELMNYSPFIYALDQTNIAITGKGILDGQSGPEAWWPWNGRTQYGWKEGEPNQRQARAALMDMAERGVAVSKRVFGDGHYLRPQFIQPYRCKNVLIEDVTIRDSPMWEIHPVLCTNVTVSGVKISSHGPNNDGCDPESCTDVLIKDCYFDTGDDCIAIKSGRNADGRRLKAPTRNVVVQSCHMKDGHGGITVGSEISGGVQNLFAENCILDSPNLDHALRIKNNAMRGGLLENLYYRNIEVGQVAHAAITIDFNYEEGEKGKFTPVVKNFVVKGLHSGKSKYALDVQGFKSAPIVDFKLEDCDFQNVAEANIVKNVQRVKLHNVKINGKPIEQLSALAKVFHRLGRREISL